MRKEFEMAQEEFDKIMDASKPVPMIMLQCGMPTSPQENANQAWRELAQERGFVWDSVVPIPSKGERFFTAEVVEGGQDVADM